MRRKPRVFGGFDGNGRYWPNVGKCCVRCQRQVNVGERSERFERRGGGVLTRHVGTCPYPERPHHERVRLQEERRESVRRAERALRYASQRLNEGMRSVTWTPTYTYTTSATSSDQWYIDHNTGTISLG